MILTIGLKSSLARAGVLVIHPAPYRDPVLREVTKRKKFDLEVLQYFDLDIGHKEWNFQVFGYKKIETNSNFCPNFGGGFNFNVVMKLFKFNYDVVVIPGYNRLTSIASIILCLIKGVPYVLSADTIRMSVKSGFKSWLKNKISDFVVNNASALWVPGVASRSYFEKKNIPSEKIYEGSYCFDTHDILRTVTTVSCFAHKNLREKYSLPRDCILLLAVGRFEKFRNYPLLARAFNLALRMRNSKNPVSLLFVGDGVERVHVEHLCALENYGNIIFCGSVSFDDLALYFSAADVFIHSGSEPFSTALEYAAISGLAIITTLKVGYVHDLVERGATPYLVDLDDLNSLASKICWILDHIDLVKKKAIEIQGAALGRDIIWAAKQLESALEYAMKQYS